MKLLAVYPYLPFPIDRGAHHRGFQLLRALARQHEVHFMALAERRQGAEYRAQFEEFCERVEVVPFEHPDWQKLIPNRLLNPLPSTIAHWTVPPAALAIGNALARHRYDAVHLFDIVLGQYFLRNHRHLPLVIDRTRVDLQYQWMEHRRMGRTWRLAVLHFENMAKLWRFERAVAKRSHFQVVCGPDDAQFVRRYLRASLKVLVLPNGVDLEYFRPESAPDPQSTEPTVLFCGAMDYNPNIDALRWYFAEMHRPLKERVPSLKVLVVGRDPVDEVRAYGRCEGVTVTGGVPDVRPFYQRAWVQIVPLRIGGGTRLKIVESIAMGTPVISTTIGAQGLDLVHQHDILYGDTADALVRETARALENTQLRSALARNGMETAHARLSWDGLGKKLCDFYAAEFRGARTSIAAPIWCS